MTLLLSLPGRSSGAPAGAAAVGLTGNGEQRFMRGIVEQEMPVPTPEGGFYFLAPRHFAETHEIFRLRDHALDQQAVSFARRLHGERAFEFEVTTGANHQVGGKPETRTVEGIVLTRSACETRCEFADDQKGGPGRIGKIVPGETRHRQWLLA
jgi:hypothetical protein